MMSSICEACEVSPIEITESHDEQAAPYRLCSACHTRLHALALRPLEWFNLAKRHGCWPFLLHDDFYDEEGAAHQPEVEVESPHLYPSPSLEDVASDPSALLDFTITRWHFETRIENAWRTLSAADVLHAITSRFAETKNLGIRSAILEVASTLGDDGEAFVRSAWSEYPGSVGLSELAKATAACLPYREGFNRVVEALAECEDREKRELMHSLAYFHSTDTLDWIEGNVGSLVTVYWGWLAADSQFDWPRATKWLELGRPLSHVALDALMAIIRPQTPLLRASSPRLHNPPDFETLSKALSLHAERDSVPRVTKATAFLLENSSVLTGGG